jgi:hypothetical protein
LNPSAIFESVEELAESDPLVFFQNSEGIKALI